MAYESVSAVRSVGLASLFSGLPCNAQTAALPLVKL